MNDAKIRLSKRFIESVAKDEEPTVDEAADFAAMVYTFPGRTEPELMLLLARYYYLTEDDGLTCEEAWRKLHEENPEFEYEEE